jgi:hypothetical protein
MVTLQIPGFNGKSWRPRALQVFFDEGETTIDLAPPLSKQQSVVRNRSCSVTGCFTMRNSIQSSMNPGGDGGTVIGGAVMGGSVIGAAVTGGRVVVSGIVTGGIVAAGTVTIGAVTGGVKLNTGVSICP